MGDGTENNTTTNEEQTVDGLSAEISKLHISTVVPTNIQRFLYLGKESGVYRAQADNPLGFPVVSHLDFNCLKAWDLGLFSDEMLEEYLKANKDTGVETLEDSLIKNKENKAVPKDGWPSPNIVSLVKEILLNNKSACRPAALFVLAACARAKGPAQPAAYSLVKQLETPEDLLLFIKYAMALTPRKRGWGGGMRRAVKSWYLDRCGSMELAENITRVRQRHLWSHKDLMKQVHIKPKHAVHHIVIAHCLFGIEKAQEVFNDIPNDDPLKMEGESVLKYLQAATKLRKLKIPKGSDVDCPEVLEAVELIKAHKFTIDHCEDSMLMAPKIWEVALDNMTIRQLIVYLPILRLNRITKNVCELTRIILVNLKNAIEMLSPGSDKKIFPPISPALVLISMQTYRRRHCEVLPSKLWFRTHALLKESSEPASQPSDPAIKTNPSQTSGEQKNSGIPRGVPKPNGKVLELMSKLLLGTVKNMKPSGKRFAIGLGNILEKVRCLINPYVVSFEAAALIYMCIEAAEAEGAVTAYSVPAEGKPCKKLRSAGSSLPNCAREIMQGMSKTPVMVDGWLQWLSKEKVSADVLLLMTDEVHIDSESNKKLLTAFNNYKRVLKLPKAKLIIVSFVCENLPDCSKFQDDALMIYGFDSNLPFIIQHFARGCF
ncbi:60 kDa SS-A/Ro ribonucleoprotein-like [Ischnura elegans]|uniref:60 kDa SS-A/Ro ribonucleoprotein-like n=1 Tax=Ischnura elegans TaxID=197161 RepID=UPI001ED888B7|nr:60 kDa SS-A/Ro ribonucleoprotein-like [Ischnura elegans]XP_046403116.1 60 kDa SS-A/Ro ribonucleoprotein-like [Ischnura elegans]